MVRRRARAEEAWGKIEDVAPVLTWGGWDQRTDSSMTLSVLALRCNGENDKGGTGRINRNKRALLCEARQNKKRREAQWQCVVKCPKGSCDK